MLNFGGVVCALLAVVLGHRANRRILQHAGKKGSAIAVAASGLGYTVLICGFLFIWSSRHDEPWSSGNETSAFSSVRNIVGSQITYSARTGATSLTELGNANLIDSVFASGTKDGYTFVVASGSPDTFTVVGRPLEHGRTGCRCLYSDETGVIRYTREDRPATADDPPVGQ